jgi:regulator of protease activity HflC (stomatin/prohibitin superfamily)
MSLGKSFERIRLGFAELRKLPPPEIARRFLNVGVIVAALLALVFFGEPGVALVAAGRVLWLAWQLGPAEPEIISATRTKAKSPQNSPSFPLSSISAGVSVMSSHIAKVVAVLIVLLLLWLLSPFAIVPAGSRGVVTTFGKVSPDVLDEGLHFIIPVAQTVHLMDVRIQKGEGAGDAASRDMQQVHTTVALNYHVNPAEAAVVFRELGQNIGDRIIVPAVQEAVKAATAQYTAEELIAKRPEVRDRIRSLLNERLVRHGVVVDEFSIVNFAFSKSFNEAIEAKTTAEQLKLKAERDLQRIRVEAEQKVTQAKAEAESLALQKQQVTAELIRLREIENQRKAIEKWDGKLPQVSGGAMPFINVQPAAR